MNYESAFQPLFTRGCGWNSCCSQIMLAN